MMICGLKGIVCKLEPTRIELDVNDVIYELAVSLQTSSKLKLDDKIHIITTQIIREDAHLLFGFLDSVEKLTFERLLKINGVGPKVALAILSTYKAESFGEIVRNKDLQSLQKVPGVGSKSAGKILLDLAGFFSEILDSTQSTQDKQSQSNIHKDAILALESLGYKTNDIKKILPQIKSTQTSEIIKEALKLL